MVTAMVRFEVELVLLVGVSLLLAVLLPSLPSVFLSKRLISF